ncbi:hypothetical protein Bca101_003989 [Brassica carinata]
MHVGGGVGGGGGQRLRTVVRHLIPEEGGDNAAAAATLSPEDSYSPNKSVRVAELDLAQRFVESNVIFLACFLQVISGINKSSSCGLEPGNPLSVRNGFTIIKASLFHFIWEEVSILFF